MEERVKKKNRSANIPTIKKDLFDVPSSLSDPEFSRGCGMGGIGGEGGRGAGGDGEKGAGRQGGGATEDLEERINTRKT